MRLKSPTIIYILEEYMLLELIDGQLGDYMNVVRKFYVELDEIAKEESDSLKIAALSFYITLITKHGLSKVNA